jgi:FkbM family methyltransferase
MTRQLHIKSLASVVLESVSPTLFWKAKIRSMRRHPCDFELRVAPFLCDAQRISIDVGASLGPYAVTLCSYSASCIAFEPRPDQAERLRQMAKAAGLSLQVEAVALSDEEGAVRMRILRLDPGRSTIESANPLEDSGGSPLDSVLVPRKTLDQYQLPDVGFIKIDVEGHEMAVLRGAEQTIRRSRPNLLVEVEERHRPGAIDEVCGFLADCGYDGYFILDGKACPMEQFDRVLHQNPSNIGTWKDRWKKRGPYVNNFFLVRREQAGLLQAAVEYVSARPDTARRKSVIPKR